MKIWKDAYQYEGVLMVSNYGEVLRLPFTNITSYKNPRKYKGGILKPYLCSKRYGKGYLTIEIDKKNISVHRLIAQTFIRPFKENEVVNHIDFNTHNNHVSNLEIISITENIRHGKKNRLKYSYNFINICKSKNNKYRISIMVKGELIQKGGFENEMLALSYLENLKRELNFNSKY